MSEQTAAEPQELVVDFITSLDGYGSADGWPGWWGLEGPEYLGWLEEEGSDFIVLMGSTTYRAVVSRFFVLYPDRDLRREVDLDL